MENRNEGDFLRVMYDKIHHINIHINSVDFFEMHEHDSLELVLVLQGRGTNNCELGKIPISPGDIILRNPHEPHEISTTESEPMTTLCLQIATSFCREYFPKLRNLHFDTARMRNIPKEDMQQIHDLMTGAAKDFFEEPPAYQLSCVGKVSLLLSLLIRRLPHTEIRAAEQMARQSKKDRKHRLVHYIDQHYREKITLEDLAVAECVTPTHLCHFFKENFDMSFREYLNKVRLEKALVLMRNPRLYLVDICLETGFSDSRYLNRVFEKRFGFTASEYRRRILAAEIKPMTVFEKEFFNTNIRYLPQDCIQILRNYMEQGGCRHTET